MSVRVFVDFDGTIVDVWARYFAVFRDYFKLPEDVYNKYRELKYLYPSDRELVSHLFHLNTVETEVYLQFKHNWLEEIEYLRLDTLIPDSQALKTFFQKNDARVLTIRKNKATFMKQLDWMGIGFLQEWAIVLESSGISAKCDWLRKHANEEPFIMIGDSEVDMQAGEISTCKAYFVKTGLRDVRYLPNGIKPAKVYENIQECFADIL